MAIFNAANPMSAYVQTTYVPEITLVGGAGNTVPVFTNNIGHYTRIGEVVFVSVEFSGDGGAEGAGTGQVTISLPLASSANNYNTPFIIGVMVNGSVSGVVTGTVASTATTIPLSYYSLVTSSIAMTGADQNNAARSIHLAFSYRV